MRHWAILDSELASKIEEMLNDAPQHQHQLPNASSPTPSWPEIAVHSPPRSNIEALLFSPQQNQRILFLFRSEKYLQTLYVWFTFLFELVSQPGKISRCWRSKPTNFWCIIQYLIAVCPVSQCSDLQFQILPPFQVTFQIHFSEVRFVHAVTAGSSVKFLPAV